jgi:replicative DNA helicase
VAKPFTDPDAERVVLQALIQYEDFLDNLLPRLRPEFFSLPSHRRIFGAIAWSRAEFRAKLGPTMLDKYLEKEQVPEDKCLNTRLRRDEILSLQTDMSPILAADTLRDLCIKRQLVDIPVRVIDELQSGRPGTDVLKAVRDSMDRIAVDAWATEIVSRTPAESVDQRKAEYEDMEQNPQKYRGIMLGVEDLDRVTNGIYSYELGIVVARSGVGKTRVLFNIGYNVSREAHVVFLTIEMPVEQVERIYTSRDGLFNYLALKTASLPPEEREKLFQTLEAQRTTSTKFHIVGMPRGCSVAAVEAKLRSLMLAYPVKLVLLDYINLMEPTHRYKDNWVEINEMARGLKQLVLSLRVPIITAAQGNRNMAKALKEGEDIGLEHLALSDRLADHCDLVVMLHQSTADKIGNIMNWKVVKYRDGANVSFKTYADLDKNFVGNVAVEIRTAAAKKEADDGEKQFGREAVAKRQIELPE